MAKIKIKDLPKGIRVSREEMKTIAGGYADPRLLGATESQLYSAFRDAIKAKAGRGWTYV